MCARVRKRVCFKSFSFRVFAIYHPPQISHVRNYIKKIEPNLKNVTADPMLLKHHPNIQIYL